MQNKTLLVCLLPLLLIFSCSNNKRDINATLQIDGPIVFHNVALVPMTAEKVVQHQSVVIQGDRIVTIGPSATTQLPENANVKAIAGVMAAGRWYDRQALNQMIGL